MTRRGPKPRRRLTALELQHLRLLFEIRRQAYEVARVYDERLEDFVLDCRERGTSVRQLAEALGVGSSTIQTWTTHARLRREEQLLD